jgi:hypothetical protein
MIKFTSQQQPLAKPTSVDSFLLLMELVKEVITGIQFAHFLVLWKTVPLGYAQMPLVNLLLV